MKEQGRQIMETADPEGYQAMQATLAMLTDKIDSLQAMADDKAKILQVCRWWYNIYLFKVMPFSQTRLHDVFLHMGFY